MKGMLLPKKVQKPRNVTLSQLQEKDPSNFGVIWLPETLAQFSADLVAEFCAAK
ncbi:MAG: hypothetical protein HY818_16405 [Acetobacterium woodii]|nr:hypothetical protein [Acetobacterium woodii]